MAKPTPRVYLLYGDDAYGIEEEVAQLRDRLGDPTTVSMNFLRLPARTASLPDVAAACAAVPFLARRRLVVLDGIEAMGKKPSDDLLELLPQLPPTTALVLTAELDTSRRNAAQEFESRNRIFQWAISNPELAFQRAFNVPQGQAFERWILQRGRKLGVEISAPAAALLAASALGDPRTADAEIRKLADYVDYGRPILPEDVELLSPAARQTDVFSLVDALGQRDAHNALKHLNRMLVDEDAAVLFRMVVRQFRMILLARAALDDGLNPQDALQVHPYVARKVAAQARNFSAADLDQVYHRLLEMDLEAKTSQADLSTSLHGLVAALAG